jgi:hypothetical protein
MGSPAVLCARQIFPVVSSPVCQAIERIGRLKTLTARGAWFGGETPECASLEEGCSGGEKCRLARLPLWARIASNKNVCEEYLEGEQEEKERAQLAR